MKTTEIIKALRRNMVETGSLVCIGCGREHNCSIYGCAIMREAADALEKMAAEKQDTDAHLKAVSDSLSEQLRPTFPENKPLTEESCGDCLYEDKFTTESPCSICIKNPRYDYLRNAYTRKPEQEGKNEKA